MAATTKHEHFWHWVIVLVLALIIIFQIKLYRGLQQIKSMVSEGILQLKEEENNTKNIETSPTTGDYKITK